MSRRYWLIQISLAVAGVALDFAAVFIGAWSPLVPAGALVGASLAMAAVGRSREGREP